MPMLMLGVAIGAAGVLLMQRLRMMLSDPPPNDEDGGCD